MADDLIKPSEIFDATVLSEQNKPFDSSKFDELMNEIADILNNKLLRRSGGIVPSDDISLGKNNIISIGDIIGADSVNSRVWRLRYDEPGEKILLEQNVNTEDNPAWEQRFAFELENDGQILVGQTESEVWNEGNDGAQSGLNADTVRGFTPSDLLGDSSGTIIDYRVVREESNQDQTEFILNNFDPGDEQQIVTSAGLVMDEGANADYERIDFEADVSGSSSNNGTYTVRPPEVSYDSNNNLTKLPVVEDIPDGGDTSGNISFGGDTFSISKVEGTSGENAFYVTNDETGRVDPSKIVFNEEREQDEVVLVTVLGFASQGSGGGLNADKIDGKEANELAGIKPVTPTEILSTGAENFNRVVDVDSAVPSRAEWVVAKVHVYGDTGKKATVGRTYVSNPNRNPSGVDQSVAASWPVYDADTSAGLNQKFADTAMTFAKLNDDQEVRVKREDSGKTQSGATSIWIMGWK